MNITRSRSSLWTLCLILLNNAFQNIFTDRTDVKTEQSPTNTLIAWHLKTKAHGYMYGQLNK